MPFQLPQNRLNVRNIQIPRRNIPLDQIIAVEGQNPLATGIETAGNVLGEAILKRAELRRQGQELARMESAYGLEPGELSGMGSTSTASDIGKYMAEQRKPTVVNVVDEQGNSRLVEVPAGKKFGGSVKLTAPSNPLSDKEKNRYLQYVKQMEAQDPVIKEIQKKQLSFASIDGLTKLVNDGNTVAFSGLGTQMARGMGEVGVLTNVDVIRYVTSGMITRKAGDRLLMWLKGKPTEATMDELADISKAMKQAWKDKAQPRYDMYINRFSGIEKISPEEFRNRLNMYSTSGAPQTPQGGGLNTLPTPTPTPFQPLVERATSDGRIALFDAITKEFKGYKK